MPPKDNSKKAAWQRNHQPEEQKTLKAQPHTNLKPAKACIVQNCKQCEVSQIESTDSTVVLVFEMAKLVS